MNVIEASAKHLEGLADLFNQYRMFYRMPSDLEAGKKFLAERIQKGESVIYIAKGGDEQMTGFAQLYPLFSSTRMKRLWLLNDLFVVKEQRRRGISKMLIARCKQLALQTMAAGIFLETEKSNDIGNQLYPAVGFELDIHHNYYIWETPL